MATGDAISVQPQSAAAESRVVFCIEEEGVWIVGCDDDVVRQIAKLAS